MRFESKEFLQLRDAWYERLKKEGFKDIEIPTADGKVSESLLRQAHANLRRAYRPGGAFYFRKASWYLHHGEFQDDTERSIWAFHCDGLSTYKIAALLKKKPNWIGSVVRRIKARLAKDERFEIQDDEAAAALAKEMNERIRQKFGRR